MPHLSRARQTLELLDELPSDITITGQPSNAIISILGNTSFRGMQEKYILDILPFGEQILIFISITNSQRKVEPFEKQFSIEDRVDARQLTCCTRAIVASRDYVKYICGYINVYTSDYFAATVLEVRIILFFRQ